jgi:secreted protein with Ig-like and vWFA domain
MIIKSLFFYPSLWFFLLLFFTWSWDELLDVQSPAANSPRLAKM